MLAKFLKYKPKFELFEKKIQMIPKMIPLYPVYACIVSACQMFYLPACLLTLTW